LLAQGRRRWPKVRILVRADSGFARDALMAWCEANHLAELGDSGVQSGFEPVSAEAQPVSGCLRAQISDIEKSSSRDSPPDSRPSVQDARNSSPETRLLAANLRKCRLFAECGD
jgi:hypothetical protein